MRSHDKRDNSYPISPDHVFFVPFVMSSWERRVVYRCSGEHGFCLPLWFRAWIKLRTLLKRLG